MKKRFLSFLPITMIIATTIQAQTITTFAGNGIQGYSGDGSIAKLAEFNSPTGMSIDSFGSLYVCDNNNHVVRKILKDGKIITVAGNWKQGWNGNGDGGKALNAEFGNPQSVTVDSKGNLYIADVSDNRIRKVDNNGIISTFAGGGTSTSLGDSGLATLVQLRNPQGVASDKFGNIYIAESEPINRIRKVDKYGIITTIAGNGNYGDRGDSGLATKAELQGPTVVSLDNSGNIYIVEPSKVRKINTNGIINTIAGNGVFGYSGDGGKAINAELNNILGLTSDINGNIYLAQEVNPCVRMIDKNGIITTIAGNGISGNSGDSGLANLAELVYPFGVVTDSSGNLFISDFRDNRIRKVSFNTLPITLSKFSAEANNISIITSWQTATEINTANFIIQHCTNGNNFINIGTVNAVGSSANGYTYTDKNPTNGINYYRLQCIDKDGSSSFSKVVIVNFGDKQNFSIIPNPARDFATISFSKSVDKAIIAVYDITGKQVIKKSLNGSLNSYKLNTQTLTNGLYVIKLNTATGNYNEKLLINR